MTAITAITAAIENDTRLVGITPSDLAEIGEYNSTGRWALVVLPDGRRVRLHSQYCSVTGDTWWSTRVEHAPSDEPAMTLGHDGCPHSETGCPGPAGYDVDEVATCRGCGRASAPYGLCDICRDYEYAEREWQRVLDDPRATLREQRWADDDLDRAARHREARLAARGSADVREPACY